ncbi:hypothetical protein, partial [Mammaliicoccus sciuri]
SLGLSWTLRQDSTHYHASPIDLDKRYSLQPPPPNPTQQKRLASHLLKMCCQSSYYTSLYEGSKLNVLI